MSNLAYDEQSAMSLSAKNFQKLALLVHRQCGIKLPPSKQTMLEGRLRRRARALGIVDVNAYCALLFDDKTAAQEMVDFLDAVTTNKTDFFREPAHFDYLTGQVLPHLARSGRRGIKFWSAAASTGAEAYTLAMVAEDFVRQQTGLTYSILGTDLSTRVLAQAVSGRYDRGMIDPVPLDLRRRHILTARDPRCREIRIAPHLREKVAFARLNLMDDTYPVADDFDVIFCRNVLIYFDKPTQTAVLTRLCRHLRKGGYLFLGHSESVVGAALPVDTVANTVFRKR